MTDRVYLLVSSFCVVEAIELLKKEGCLELGLSKQDNSWLLSFNLPIKKSSADDSLTENCPVEEHTRLFPPICHKCASLNICLEKKDWQYCNGSLFTERLPNQYTLDDIKAANKAQDIGG